MNHGIQVTFKFEFVYCNSRLPQIYLILQFCFLTDLVVECVTNNFQKIRDSLYFEITADCLQQEGIIDLGQRHRDSRFWRGKLVKESIKKGAEGCEILMRCLQLQGIDIYDDPFMTWKKKRVGKNITRAEIRKGERRNNCRIS